MHFAKISLESAKVKAQSAKINAESVDSEPEIVVSKPGIKSPKAGIKSREVRTTKHKPEIANFIIITAINPASFNIMKSTEGMVMVYLGGMGSLSGSVLSAILFTFLLEALRPLQILKWVILPLILLMQFRPEGIMGNKELPEIYARLRERWRVKRGSEGGRRPHQMP